MPAQHVVPDVSGASAADSAEAKLARATHRSYLSDLDIIASTILAVVWSGRESQSKSVQDMANIQTAAVTYDSSGRLYIAGNGLHLDNKLFLKNTDPTKLTPQELARLYDVTSEFHIGATTMTAAAPKRTGKGVITVEKIVTPGMIKRTTYRPLFAYNEPVFETKEELAALLQNVFREDNQPVPIACHWVGPPDQFPIHAEVMLAKFVETYRATFPVTPKIGVSKPCCRKCAGHLDTAQIGYSCYSDVNPGAEAWLAAGAKQIETKQLW
jgi:hypothetical protein